MGLRALSAWASRHRGRLAVGVLSLLYASSLAIAYVRWISPIHGTGIYPAQGGTLAGIVGVLLASAPALWLPLTLGRPAHLFLWIFYILGVLPAVLMPFLMYAAVTAHFLAYAFVVASSFIALCALLPLARPRALLRPRLTARVRVGILVGAAILGYAVVAWLAGARVGYVPFMDVYATRVQFYGSTARFGRPFGYLLGALGFVVNPMLLAVGVDTRRSWLAALGLLATAYLYLLTGTKSFLLVSIFGTGVALLALTRRGRPEGRHAAWIPLSALAIAVAALAIDAAAHQATLSDITVRRLFLVPGVVDARYIEFFASNPKSHLSHSILSPFLDPVYAQPIPQLIGERFFGGADWANANVYGDAYSNFGLIGIVGATVLAGLLLYLWECAGAGMSPLPVASLFVVQAYVLANGALLTSILTHGGAAALLALYLLAPATGTSEERSGPPTA